MTAKASTSLALAVASVSIGALGLAYAVSGKGPGGGGGGQKYTVDLTVEDSSTGKPISGVSLSFDYDFGTTDSAGAVSFPGISAGKHSVIADAQGYQQLQETVTISVSATSFTVKLVPCQPPAGGCPSGTKWNSSACECASQRVASIFSVYGSNIGFSQGWYVHDNVGLLGGSVLCAGVTPDGDPGCGGKCGAPALAEAVVVKVVDANGDPVSGERISASVSSPGSLYWQTADGATHGHFTIGLDSLSKVTDSNGEATFYVVFTIFGDSANSGLILYCTGPGVAHQTIDALFAAQVASDPQYQVAVSVAMDASIWAYAYP